MLKAVFDTVVFVRSLINPFSNCGRIVFDHAARYRLFVSEPLVREVLEVLSRPELKAKFRSLAGLDFGQVVGLLGEAEAVELDQVPNISRDPDDDKFLATAAAAEADYLVSEDTDLLVLERYGRTRIVNAAAFLDVLDRSN